MRDSLVDQSMLFTRLYVMQGEKIKAWFTSHASKEYFGVESTTFLSTKKFLKNLPNGKMNCQMFLFIGEAIKTAVSFSKPQCPCAILLLGDYSKHSFSVT